MLTWITNELRATRAFIRRWFLRSMFLFLHLVVVFAGCYLLVQWMARGRCYNAVDKVPARVCGLVLGCSPHGGNPYFITRIKAAADLYHAGKVHYLVVSGDNFREGYNEPAEMKKALIKEGVPADKIYCDYAGFRTLDSIVRAKEIFGQEEFTVISQRFHNERALYIARRKGMRDSVAFDAANPATSSVIKMHVREVGARIMAILDVEMFKTDPRFLGPKVPIGPTTPPVDAKS